VLRNTRLDLIIGQGCSEGAIGVANTGGDRLLVRVLAFVRLLGASSVVVGNVLVPRLSAVSIERVTDAKLEASEVRGLVHDHVIVANSVHSSEGRAHVGLIEAQTERINGTEVLGTDVGLTTEVQLTPSIASQTQSSLTTEQTITLTMSTTTQIEAAFQLEHSAQAVAQIFSTFQTPAIAGLNAVDHANALAVDAFVGFTSAAGAAANFLITNTTVQDTVQGNRRFCLSNTEEADGESSSEQSLFHVRNLRRFE